MDELGLAILKVFIIFEKTDPNLHIRRNNIDSNLIPTYKSEQIDSKLISLISEEYLTTPDNGKSFALTVKGSNLLK